jgi:hypothetical protein
MASKPPKVLKHTHRMKGRRRPSFFAVIVLGSKRSISVALLPKLSLPVLKITFRGEEGNLQTNAAKSFFEAKQKKDELLLIVRTILHQITFTGNAMLLYSMMSMFFLSLNYMLQNAKMSCLPVQSQSDEHKKEKDGPEKGT